MAFKPSHDTKTLSLYCVYYVKNANYKAWHIMHSLSNIYVPPPENTKCLCKFTYFVSRKITFYTALTINNFKQ